MKGSSIPLLITMAQLPTSFSSKFQTLEENSSDTASISFRLRQNRPLIWAPRFRGPCRSQNLEKKKKTFQRTYKSQSLSHVRLFVTPWTVAHQAPLSTEFSRQEYWSWLPFPSPGALPNSGIKPRSPALQVDSLPKEPPENIWVSLSLGSTCSS